MKIEDITESAKPADTVDAQIKRLVDDIRKDIGSFGLARIDGRSSVLNVSGRQIQRVFGIDLRELAYQSAKQSKTSWLHRNGKDNYSMGYKF